MNRTETYLWERFKSNSTINGLIQSCPETTFWLYSIEVLKIKRSGPSLRKMRSSLRSIRQKNRAELSSMRTSLDMITDYIRKRVGHLAS